MTAQMANGGYKIKPHILKDDTINYQDVINKIKLGQSNYPFHERNYLDEIDISYYQRMYHKKSNINFVLDAMFGSTNERYGTSFRSRYDDPKYQFAGKTGTSQVRRITELDRELDLDTEQIEYKKRDHALYIAFAPYRDPRYSISVLIEHGGSGSKAAAPLASKLIKKIIDRHKLREQFNNGDTSLA
jgi:penicillin-binding protein 2